MAARAGYGPASIRINSAAFYQLDYQARESGSLFTGRPVQLLADVAIHPKIASLGGLTGTPGWTRTNDHPIISRTLKPSELPGHINGTVAVPASILKHRHLRPLLIQEPSSFKG